MNYLYLIGNGFDLAHGLKTSYKNFVFDYLANALNQVQTGGSSDGKLMTLTNYNSIGFKRESFTTIPQLLNFIKANHIKQDYSKNPFWGEIVSNNKGNRWVDIESFYFLKLKKLYDENKRNISGNFSPTDNIEKKVNALNRCLNDIKYELSHYLKSLPTNQVSPIPSINEILTEFNQRRGSEILYLNFNYTSTISNYLDSAELNQVSYIHGSLTEVENDDLIFGYGDEMDPFYPKIENLNSNHFLTHIKSFGYFKNDRYQKLIRFINSGLFEVRILGHSCGISDRLLLNTIFENRNCWSIRIFYYKKNEQENDYTEKTQEISRHFKPKNKKRMREIIVSLDHSKPLVP